MAVAPENTCLSQDQGERLPRRNRAKAKSRRTDSVTMICCRSTTSCGNVPAHHQRPGSAAHDLKTPLAILNGYIELLQSEKLGPLNDRQREVLGDMQSSGQRLQHFIQDFLSLQRPRNRRDEDAVRDGRHERLPFGSLPLVVESLSGKRPGAVLPGKRQAARFPFDSPKMQRVISNLLENASKFTPGGGTVWLHAEPYMWERRSPSSRRAKRTPSAAAATAQLGEGQRLRYRPGNSGRVPH